VIIAGWNRISKLANHCTWYYKADLDIYKTYVSTRDENNNPIRQLDSFYFYVKKPRSKTYQFHSSIESTKSNLISLINTVESSLIKDRHLELEVSIGLGTERVFFHKSLLNKLLTMLNNMLDEISIKGETNVTKQ